MERHNRVARIHRVLSWIYGLLIVLFLAAHAVSSKKGSISVIVFILVLLGCLFALHYFTSKGARDKKNWARNISRGIAFLMLTAVPIGTLIGIYLLSNSWDVWNESECERSGT